MTKRTSALAGAAAAAIILGGCGGSAHVIGAAAPLAAISPQAFAARFPGAPGLLRGTEVADGVGQWRAGDRVLLGLSFEHGAAPTDRMLLVDLGSEPGRHPRFRRKVGVFGDEIEIDSPTRATRLRVYDAQGNLLADNPGQLAEVFLDYGPYEVARIGGGYAIATGEPDKPRENPHPEVTLQSLEPGVYGMMSLLAFGEGAGANPTLEGLIRQAFTTGQKLSLLWSWGRFEIRIGDVATLAPGVGPLEGLGVDDAYDSQIRVSVSGKEALHGRVILAPTYAPLGLCGGIVAAELVNSSDPSIRARVVLLGAARGPEDANITTTDSRTGR
ncbi:MAG: hypothetical protein IPJ41_04850 [Phycisphaerales bacterium]|nr:hypothetical protein [Phycisphaerales bacterium]